MVRNARIDLRKHTIGNTTGYAIIADGDIAIIGIDGIVLDVTGMYLRLNTTGRSYVGADALRLEGDPIERRVEFTSTDEVIDFGAQRVTFEIGGLIQIGGGVRFSKKPDGSIDIALNRAFVNIDIDNAGDFAVPEVSLVGNANFSIGGAQGFKLQSFKINDFQLFSDSGALTEPTANEVTNFQVTADIKSPFAGAVLSRSVFNTTGYIDIQFNDVNGVGLNVDSIMGAADGAEFELFVNGRAASQFGITVGSRPTKVAGLKNVFRYTITGAIPEAGEVSIRFLPGSFSDINGNTNAAESEYFTLLNPLPGGVLPPAGPVAMLANPGSGSSISLIQINGQRYIDVTFVSRTGAAINEASINGDEFKLSGAITSDLLIVAGSGGIPQIIGTPLKIGTNTWRYFLRVRQPTPTTTTTTTTTTTPVPAPAPFTTGLVTVTFIAGSFETVDGGLNVQRIETFTVDPSQAGEKVDGGVIKLGPLELQGPTVGIADFGFVDGRVVLTLAIGVQRASLAFGQNQQPGANGMTQQQNSGVTVDLLGILGTFDVSVDVFGLLGGNVDIELTGKWSLNVQSLEVHVPDVVRITAEGIRVQYDPKSEVEDQEIISIDRAMIQFEKFALRGEISTYDPTPGNPGDETPGLVIRAERLRPRHRPDLLWLRGVAARHGVRRDAGDDGRSDDQWRHQGPDRQHHRVRRHPVHHRELRASPSARSSTSTARSSSPPAAPSSSRARPSTRRSPTATPPTTARPMAGPTPRRCDCSSTSRTVGSTGSSSKSTPSSSTSTTSSR